MTAQGLGIKIGLFLMVIFLRVLGNVEAQTKSILINCGTNSSFTIDGEKWIGDTSSPSSNITLSSPSIEAFTSSAINGDPNHASLYKTARFFSKPLNYTLRQGEPGNYFIRLHFFPFVFQNYSANRSNFDVRTNGFTLASNLNVPYAISQRKNSSLSALVKEFYVPIETNTIVIAFFPKEGSFGFVSAIEIVQVTHDLFVGLVNEVSGNGSNAGLGKRGVETMYRLNVGGDSVKPDQDSGFRRMWEEDSGYMINSDAGLESRNKSRITYASPNDTSIAPLLVYETARTMANTLVMDRRFNMSWRLKVDPGFDYLIRLHFCELEYDKPSQRVFRIYINNKTAAENVDVFARAGGMNKAYHVDYSDAMSPESNRLWVQVGPGTPTGSQGSDALLNGIEIFKLSRDGNLAYVQNHDDERGRRNSKVVLWLGIGTAIASISACIGWLIISVFRKQETVKLKHVGLKGKKRSSHGRWGRRIALADIKAATNNFDESLVIGVGGFGKVYKGQMKATLAAIKRSNPQSQQGLSEFETEIEFLSKLRHRHLVPLIGFCDEQKEMILVYEYMANGTLRSHLFGSGLPPLSWKRRLEICIGAARGLHYLHTGSERGVIHRDVKTTNILLDENFVAKMADFGLSKSGPPVEHTHVSTAVKGSYGYLDPEYYRNERLTAKSDVYSFGVVLFETVCARAVINPALPQDQINLAEWAVLNQRLGSLETIIDPSLKGGYCPESLTRFREIAEKCVADEGKARPNMGEVLCCLEYSLQIHEAWLQSNNDVLDQNSVSHHL
ncbi:unnamed protein product [Cuscuta campestris]|uniref:Protein kinase domain-containing protein n=1 Tax=Cuscuta campestris TaxID=132261 RepID=A0A484L7V0_9ASTE|nr:unnamed protein product [Cuscuta campestris]